MIDFHTPYEAFFVDVDPKRVERGYTDIYPEVELVAVD